MNRLFILIFLNGCFFGIYQRPKTLGEGNMDFSFGASFQFTTNPYDRRDIESNGYRLLPNLGFDFAYGVLNGFDVGIHFSGAGLGPFARFSLFKQKINYVENEFILAPFVMYDFLFSKSVGLRLDAIYSWQLNRYFEPFIFYQVYYHPYFEKFASEPLGGKPVGNIGSGFYHFFGLASGFNIYLTKKKSKKEPPDLRFNFELGFLPVELASQNKIIPVLNFGVSFGGSGLFTCYRDGYYQFCPGDIFIRIISLIFGAGLN
ncbi:MAG: hypothetical protein ABIL52_03620 [candidate division WOR-3 bacterium]